MKNIIRYTALLIAFVLCIFGVTSCGDVLESAPDSVANAYSVGDNFQVDDKHFKLKEEFKISDKKDGYIDEVNLNVTVTGYDASFTYFNCFMTITWYYTEITDANPTGIDREFATTIELNASGDGKYSHKFKLQGCRNISNVRTEVKWVGTATRI